MTSLSLHKLIGLLTCCITLLFITNPIFSQTILDDYKQALNMNKTISGKVFKQKVTPHWFPDDTRFWYKNSLHDGKTEFILVNALSGRRQHAFDHQKLAQALSEKCNKDFSPEKLQINNLLFTDSGSDITFTADDKKFNCSLQNYNLTILQDDPSAGSLQPQSRIRPSKNSDQETSIIITNKTKDTLHVYWIDTRRQRINYGKLEPEQKNNQHTFVGHVWLITDMENKKGAVFTAAYDNTDAVITENTLTQETMKSNERRKNRRSQADSPDKNWTAFIKEQNIFLKDTRDNSEFALTSDGTQDHPYQPPFHWSPDSKKIVALRVQKGRNRQISFIESSPKDQLQPKLHTFTYEKPGDKIDIEKPCLFDIITKKQLPVPDELFSNPWSISDIHWSPDSSRFFFLYNQRGHQLLRVISINSDTCQPQIIVDEQSPTFIDYSGKKFISYIDQTNELLWMSERDGFNHLYLYDTYSGQVKNQITKGNWVVREIENLDSENRQIWFYTGGVHPNQDPYYLHLCRINFDGSDFTILTQADGTHEIDFSPERKYFFDRWSRVDHPPVTELHDSKTGKLICTLENADWTELLKTGWLPPERFTAKGRDGKTDIYGIIIRPADFDPNVKYPVIEQIYAGPHGSFVPKSFGLLTKQNSLAKLGFIIVQIDGMGTSHRSKAFQDVCWKNIADSGFPDRILWIKAAAEKYPYMDISKVGIYGGSAGGQSALAALLSHGDFYKVAVSDCGCHDNRMDKIWWNEQWMGWPVGPHYQEQSNVTQAHKLQGKLLLTVGELDRNVDPASTMQVVNALVEAQKDFDMLVIPGHDHGAGETPYANRRRMDYFVKHLLNKEPPDWNDPKITEAVK